jgi:hypothetical protein
MTAPSFDLHYEIMVANLGEIKLSLKINTATVGRILSIARRRFVTAWMNK